MFSRTSHRRVAPSGRGEICEFLITSESSLLEESKGSEVYEIVLGWKGTGSPAGPPALDGCAALVKHKP